MRKRNRRIPPTAPNPGARRQYLMDNYSTIPSYQDLKFGHVMYLFLEVTDKKCRETTEAIQATVPFPCRVMMPQISVIIKLYYNKFKNMIRQREKDRFFGFCSRPLSSLNVIRELAPAPSHDIQLDLQLGASIECETSEQCPSLESEPLPTPVSGPTLRQGLLSPKELKMKERIEVISRNWRLLKERHYTRSGIRRNVIRRREEEIQNKNATIACLKKELKTARASLEELQQLTKHTEEHLKDSNKHFKESNKQKRKKEKARNTAAKNGLKLKIDMRAKEVIPCFERELQIDETVTDSLEQ